MQVSGSGESGGTAGGRGTQGGRQEWSTMVVRSGGAAGPLPALGFARAAPPPKTAWGRGGRRGLRALAHGWRRCAGWVSRRCRSAVREGGLPEVPAAGFNRRMAADRWKFRRRIAPLRSRLREGCAPGGPGRRRRVRGCRGSARMRGAAGGPARLATAVSLPTARAARFGAPAPNTPQTRSSNAVEAGGNERAGPEARGRLFRSTVRPRGRRNDQLCWWARPDCTSRCRAVLPGTAM
jgi:hypothetical protein